MVFVSSRILCRSIFLVCVLVLFVLILTALISGLEPCQDLRGSNADTTGGIFGRVDAVHISQEAQKSTSGYHGHMQVFVQCLHQHTSLEEFLLFFSSSRLDALRRESGIRSV